MKIINVNIDKQLRWAFELGVGIIIGLGILWLVWLAFYQVARAVCVP